MFIHQIDPVLLSLGPLQIRYYGLIYALGFVLAYFFLRHFIRQKKLHMREQELDTYIIYLMLGVVLGARLFEILFYNLPFYLEHPAELLAIWHGGLSFHGGLAGAVFSTWLFCKKKKIPLLHLCDYVVIPGAFALALGRIGNFLNGELPGRVSDVWWAVKFPGYEGYRHPSQIYEVLKNLVIFAAVLVNVRKQHKEGYLLGLFLFWYGLLRFLVEFVREPETMVWFLTMGQALSIPLIILGLYFIKRKR